MQKPIVIKGRSRDPHDSRSPEEGPLMKTTVRIFAVGAFVLVVFGLPQQVGGQQPQAPPPKDRTTQIQADMNPRQRYHSEQFSKYRTHTRLLDLRKSVSISVDWT